jgi:hypothetical protein
MDLSSEKKRIVLAMKKFEGHPRNKPTKAIWDSRKYELFGKGYNEKGTGRGRRNVAIFIQLSSLGCGVEKCLVRVPASAHTMLYWFCRIRFNNLLVIRAQIGVAGRQQCGITVKRCKIAGEE